MLQNTTIVQKMVNDESHRSLIRFHEGTISILQAVVIVFVEEAETIGARSHCSLITNRRSNDKANATPTPSSRLTARSGLPPRVMAPLS